jgi:hypothetical protein
MMALPPQKLMAIVMQKYLSGRPCKIYGHAISA